LFILLRRISAPAQRDSRWRGSPASLLSRCAGWRAFGARGFRFAECACGADPFSRSAQSDLSAFISFLSRERKETKQRKETAGRAKFACTPGALPLDFKCYRHPWHFPFETFVLAYHLKSRDAEERPPSGESTGLATGKFCTAGPSYPAQLGTRALKM
jgi:hypothetical protein